MTGGGHAGRLLDGRMAPGRMRRVLVGKSGPGGKGGGGAALSELVRPPGG